MYRSLCCATCSLATLSLLLLASPAAAQPPLVITEDTVIDYEVTRQTVEVRGGRLTLVDGGRIYTLNVFGGASASIVGGEIYGHFSTHPDSIDNVISGGHISAADSLRNTLVTGGDFDYAMLMSTTRFEGGVVHQADARSATVSGGTIDYVQVNDGLPLVVNSGSIGEIEGAFVLNGGSLELGWGDPDLVFNINGGTAGELVGGLRANISDGIVQTLTSTPFTQTGGEISGDVLLSDLNFISGGKQSGVLYGDENGNQKSVLRVYGHNLKLTDQKLSGELLDGTQPNGYVIESENLLVVLHEGPQLIGDGNGDGRVDLEDLNGVRNEFGTSISIYDMNFDGEVGLEDLNMVRNNFGSSSQSPVPEPASFVLAMVLLPMCLNTIRRSSRYSCRRQP